MNIEFEIPIKDFLKGFGGSLPNVEDYQYYKNLEDRKIIINKEVGDTLVESAILPLMEMDNDGSNKPITIILNTPGGDVYDGFALVDAIDHIKNCEVTIFIISMAASMGLHIAMAGHNNPKVKTVCHKFSVGLLHSGSESVSGTTHAVRDLFNFSQKYEEKIKQFVLSHSNIDDDMYEKVYRQELWLDADEMLRLGIVDVII